MYLQYPLVHEGHNRRPHLGLNSYLTDSHDAVSSKDSTLEDVDGGSCHCRPVWELPLKHIPPACRRHRGGIRVAYGEGAGGGGRGGNIAAA